MFQPLSDPEKLKSHAFVSSNFFSSAAILEHGATRPPAWDCVSATRLKTPFLHRKISHDCTPKCLGGVHTYVEKNCGKFFFFHFFRSSPDLCVSLPVAQKDRFGVPFRSHVRILSAAASPLVGNFFFARPRLELIILRLCGVRKIGEMRRACLFFLLSIVGGAGVSRTPVAAPRLR